MHGLIQDLEDGYIKRIAFVVPPAASWPLPLYELALLTAERAFDMCVDVELTLVTSEPSPLAVFGGAVSGEVTGLLAEAGVTVRCGVDVAAMPVLRARPAPELCASRGRPVVTVPELIGPAIQGCRMTPRVSAGRRARPRDRGAGRVRRRRCDGLRDQAGWDRLPTGRCGGRGDRRLRRRCDRSAAVRSGAARDPATERDARRLLRCSAATAAAERRGGESDRPRTKFVGRELWGLLDELQAGVR